MQLISQGAPLAAAGAFPFHPRFAEFIQRDEVRHIGVCILILMACAQVVQIFTLWGASKMIVDNDHCTFGNAFKVWLLGLLLWIAFVAGLVFAVPWMIRTGEYWRTFLVAGGMLMTWLLLAFLIPMKVYVTGFLRAFAILVLAGCINGGVMKVAEVIVPRVMHLEKDIASLQTTFGKTKAEQQEFAIRLLGQGKPDEIDRLLDDALRPIGPQSPLADREAALRNIQQKLNARQRSLPAGDGHAATVYQNQLNRYLQFRYQLITARNSSVAKPAQ